MAPTKRDPTDNKLGTTRTYFTEFDPLVQQRYHSETSVSVLETKLRLSSMFNDVVTVAASHLIESDTAYRVMTNNPEFLQERIVVPAINADFDSFTDFVDKKSSHPDRYGGLRTSNNQTTDDLRDRAEIYDDLTDTLMNFELADMSGSFQQGLLSELESSSSPLYQRVAPNIDPEKLARIIKDQDVVTRDDVRNLAETLPEEVRNQLFDYIQVNYHLTGGAHHHAGLNLPPKELELVNEKFRRSIHIDETIAEPQEQKMFKRGLHELIEILTLDYDPVSKLDSAEFSDIHQSTVGQDFRSDVEDIIMDIDSYTSNSNTKTQLDDTREELQMELQNRYADSAANPEKTQWKIESTLYSSNVRQLLVGRSTSRDVVTVDDPVVEILLDNTSDSLGAEFSFSEEAYAREDE